MSSDNPQDRVKAAKETDIKSQGNSNQRQARNAREKPEDLGRATGNKREPGRIDNQTAIRQQSELRDERDKGYGSEYIGNEYNDVEVDEKEPGENEAA
jgi:hypothetical protein